MEIINGQWPWYVSGPLLGLMVPLLLWLGNKQFGISSTLRHICAACIPSKVKFFDYNWKKESWSFFLVGGTLLGGSLSAFCLNGLSTPEISTTTTEMMTEWGLPMTKGLAPEMLMDFSAIKSFGGWIVLVMGGFLVGFGTRWANGCTSGHAIMGLSMLNLGSLVAVIGFFIGGLAISHLLLPHIF
ncbi:MAG: YeeE/YedE family protein [Flavobacteriales bacterium]